MAHWHRFFFENCKMNNQSMWFISQIRLSDIYNGYNNATEYYGFCSSKSHHFYCVRLQVLPQAHCSLIALNWLPTKETHNCNRIMVLCLRWKELVESLNRRSGLGDAFTQECYFLPQSGKQTRKLKHNTVYCATSTRMRLKMCVYACRRLECWRSC